MPTVIISRGRSTPRMSLIIVLAGLLFATVTLFASPAKASREPLTCKDDPDFEFKKPKKNGTLRNCDYIKTLNGQKKKNVCKKRINKGKTGPRVMKVCQDACGMCDPIDVCPKKFVKSGKSKRKQKQVEGGDCSNFTPGMSCDYNYEYYGGCGENDPITCTASDTYTCNGDSIWEKSSFEHFPCVIEGDGFLTSGEFPIGDSCDPGEFCTLEPPEQGTKCDASQVNLECPYNYVYTGCNFQDGFDCDATSYYACNDDQTWDLIQWMVEPCDDPAQGSVGGETCQPCPKVEPEDICPSPSEKPEYGKVCDVEGITCNYDFEITGCHAKELQCSPSSMFTCTNGSWDMIVSLPTPPCLPTGKTCPKEKPSSLSCRQNGYDPGLTCPFDYRDSSCDKNIEECTATESWTCTESHGWIIAIADFMCLDAPDDFLHSCDPNACPLVEPMSGEKCSDIEGSCDYGYQYTGCTADDIQCSASRFYTCGSNGTWELALASPIFCPAVVTLPVPPIGEKCDPLACPLYIPEDDSGCDPAQRKLSCPYYEYVGCNYQDGFQCTEAATAVCSDDLEWKVVRLAPTLCVYEESDSVRGKTCEPCLEVEPKDNCPSSSERPIGGKICDGDEEGMTCTYDFVVSGCSEDELQCLGTSFFTCSGTWMEGIADPVRCPDKTCPNEKPENGANCGQGGLQCEYNYRNLSCIEDEEVCSATEFYNCMNGSWIVTVQDSFCKVYPENHGAECYP